MATVKEFLSNYTEIVDDNAKLQLIFSCDYATVEGIITFTSLAIFPIRDVPECFKKCHIKETIDIEADEATLELIEHCVNKNWELK